MDISNHRRHEHHLRKRVPVPVPAPVAEPQRQEGGGTMTVVEVVFVTQQPTFDGEPAGFVTESFESSLEPVTVVVTAQPTQSPSPSPSVKKQTVEDVEAEQSQTTFRKSTKSASSSSASTVSSRSSTITQAATRTSSLRSSTATLDSASSSSSPSATSAPTNSAGLTIGAYAGIVGGAVAAILVLIVIIAVVLKRRKKNSNYEKPEDEKNLNRLSFNDRAPPSPVPMPTVITPAAAPKLEVRPMTQFDSSFFASSNTDNMKPEEKPIRAPPAALSIDNKKNLGLGPFETPEPSPAMSAFSDNSNMSLPIQGATNNSAPSPVHRILVDFKPSMADELELNAGEVVRLLHEYDDGWALCIRMDRSQQGVCPRTCLSPRPVKPRPPPSPRGPPPPPQNNGMRGPPGPPGPPRPQSPAQRPHSPGMGPGSRPQSPRSPGPNRPPMSPKGMPGPPRRPGGPDSRPSSPMGNRQPHPLSKVQRDDDIQFHAM
ncbi:hypothetical protein ABW19_dt0208129 [Dactylella cylindrospora]|nr:hypothetical protein ABW19_dt0208129 [Dactylella cylindrospora]